MSSFAYELPTHQLPLYHRYVCSFLQACDSFKKLNLLDERFASLELPSLHATAKEQTLRFDKPCSYTPLQASFEENPLDAWTLKCNITLEDNDVHTTEPSRTQCMHLLCLHTCMQRYPALPTQALIKSHNSDSK